MPRLVAFLLLLALAACGDPQASAALLPSEPFDVSELTLRGPEGDEVEVPVYVAADPATRSVGLMEREELPEGAGMVFLFPGESTGSFYMYRTQIPLSIAFYDQAGEVLRVLDMQPCASEDSAACERYDPGVAYRGAIEVNQGFFDEAGVTEGWTVELPTDLPTPS
jgi:uncharacterized protein